LAAFATFLDLYDHRVPWTGLATFGLAVATAGARVDENGVARWQGWRIALLLACTVVIVGRVFWQWV
jgi:hypothetical protein